MELTLLPILIKLFLFQVNQCYSIHLHKPKKSGNDQLIVLLSSTISHPTTTPSKFLLVPPPTYIINCSPFHYIDLSSYLYLLQGWLQKTRQTWFSMSVRIISVQTPHRSHCLRFQLLTRVWRPISLSPSHHPILCLMCSSILSVLSSFCIYHQFYQEYLGLCGGSSFLCLGFISSLLFQGLPWPIFPK